MSREPHDPLGESTLETEPAGETQSAGAVACLTVACHPDATRVGERALLTRLLAGKTIEVARAKTEFSHPGQSSATAVPLADPYLTRAPLKFRAGNAGAVIVDASEAPIRADGTSLLGSRCFEHEQLEHGVVLELSSRIALLLHTTSFLSPASTEPLLGYSDGIERVRQQVKRAAPFEMPVLIRGETGVGKELAARALHLQSRRAQHECVAVNMATLNENTAHSTLFGHVRGAFTGASDKRVGLFEQANGGTLFLDEVGETPDSVQPMLLRVLETGRFTPLGASKEITVDVRVLAATDAPLETSVQSGDFRSALLHRLAGYELLLPALRERRSDIPLLFVHLLRQELQAVGEVAWLDTKSDPRIARIPSSVMGALLDYEFPGNVRELRNLARHLLVANAGKPQLVLDESVSELMQVRAARSEIGDLRAPAVPRSRPLSASPPTLEPPPTAAPELDAATLLAALRKHDFSPKRAAEELGIANSTLHYLMQKTGLARRASDYSKEELQAALAAAGGNVENAAQTLQVSERALTMAARRFGLVE